MNTITKEELKRSLSKKPYKVDKQIGEGNFGQAFLVTHSKEKKQYILKVIKPDKDDDEAKELAEREVDLLSHINHQFIVFYKDSFALDTAIFLIMEYCEGGDLVSVIQEHKPSNFLPENQIIKWFIQLALALEYIHIRAILHRDLKPANIFLSKDKDIKVGDFGIARTLDIPGEMAKTSIGTPLYLSPEMLQALPYDNKADVWAFGCCIYELMALKPAIDPFLVLRGQWIVNDMPRNYSPELVGLLDHILTLDPQARPSIDDILNEPFIERQPLLQKYHEAEGKRATMRAQGNSTAQHSTPHNSTAQNSTPQNSSTPRSDKPKSVFFETIRNVFSTTKPAPWLGTPEELLKKLGHEFNTRGQLVEIDTKNPFNYEIPGKSKKENEARYKEIGEQIVRYIYQRLEKDLKMKRLYLPLSANQAQAESFIYHTENVFSNPEKLLVLVHGPGPVRAGQWSRKVIMNDSIEKGSQIPWIQEAILDGFAVIVLNPNITPPEVLDKPAGDLYQEYSDCEKHVFYVWDKVIMDKVKPKWIAFGSHSAGGSLTTDLAYAREKDFVKCVYAIAFTDSVHQIKRQSDSIGAFYYEHAKNWVKSKNALDTPELSLINDAPKVSAGEERHEWTSWACMQSAFKFFDQQYPKRV